MSRRRAPCASVFAIASRNRPALLSALLDEHPLPSRAPGVDDRRGSGPDHGAAVPTDHGDIPSLGLRFGALAYSTSERIAGGFGRGTRRARRVDRDALRYTRRTPSISLR